MKISLDLPELEWAAKYGIMRHIEALKENKPNMNVTRRSDDWRAHIEGCCGELAFSKFLGIPWPATVNTYQKKRDVAGYEVKTRSASYYELPIPQHANPDHPYVLVRGVSPHMEIIGHCFARDGMKSEYVQNYGKRPAYFVPDAALQKFPDPDPRLFGGEPELLADNLAKDVLFAANRCCEAEVIGRKLRVNWPQIRVLASYACKQVIPDKILGKAVDWDARIRQLLGKLAFSYYVDNYVWNGGDSYCTGHGIEEIKVTTVSSDRRLDYHLNIPQDDKCLHVLVIEQLPWFEIVGGLYLSEARKISGAIFHSGVAMVDYDDIPHL